MATWSSSLPIAYRLYLPKEWAEDPERRKKTDVPEEVEFQTKPDIALEEIRTAVAASPDRGVVLAGAAYGIHTEFRDGLTDTRPAICCRRAKFDDSLGAWQSLYRKATRKNGTASAVIARNTDHQPVPVKQLAMKLPSTAVREITWRESTDRKLQSRFAAVRVRPAHRDYWKGGASRGGMVADRMAARDFEGRNWRGFHQHATRCIAGYGFLVAERNRFPSLPGPVMLDSSPPGRRRTSAHAGRRARPERHNPTRSRHCASFWRACCCGNCFTVPSVDRLRAERPC